MWCIENGIVFVLRGLSIVDLSCLFLGKKMSEVRPSVYCFKKKKTFLQWKIMLKIIAVNQKNHALSFKIMNP